MSIFNKKLIEILKERRNFYITFSKDIKYKKINYPRRPSNGVCVYLKSNEYFKKLLQEYIWLFNDYNLLISRILELIKGDLSLDSFKLYIDDVHKELTLLEKDVYFEPNNFELTNDSSIGENYKNKIDRTLTNIWANNTVIAKIIPESKVISIAEGYLFNEGDEFRIIATLEDIFKYYEQFIKFYVSKLYIEV